MSDISKISPDNGLTIYNIKDIESRKRVPESLLKDTVGWSGKNLLVYPYTIDSATIANTLYAVKSNGAISLNGTASSNANLVFHNRSDYFTDDNPIILRAGTYIVSKQDTIIEFDLLRTVNGVLDIVANIPAYKKTATFTLTEDTQIGARINLINGVTYNFDFHPMIRKADIADDTYEPYHPSVEQTLRDAEVIEGKNLLPYPNLGTREGINSTGVITSNGTLYLTDYVDISGIETLNFKAESVVGTVYLRYAFYDSSKTFISRPDKTATANTVITQSVPSNAKYIRFNFEDSSTNYMTSPMLWDSADPDPTFEPYYIPLKDSKFDRAEQRVLGAKNILPYPYKETTKTISGITFTDNGDGTITANGTATAQVSFMLKDRYDKNFVLPKGEYIATGCPSGGSNNGYRMQFSKNKVWDNPASGFDSFDNDIGNGSVISLSDKAQMTTNIVIANGVTVNNLVFKPMLRLASDPDDTYAPYAMTNRELTELAAMGWTTPTELDISQTVLNGYGTLKITENVSQHLAALIWLGNAQAPSSPLTLQNFSLVNQITEKPIAQWNGVMRRGDCVIINIDKTATIMTGTQNWSSCYVIFPTKP